MKRVPLVLGYAALLLTASWLGVSLDACLARRATAQTNDEFHREMRMRMMMRDEATAPEVVGAPVISGTSAVVTYARNGDPLTITVDASADQEVTFTIKAVYTSSYTQYVIPTTAWFTWVTAAVGIHSENSATGVTSIDDMELEVGPRAFHSDHIVLTVDAVNASAEHATQVEILDFDLDYPFSDPGANPAQDDHAIAITYVGSHYPTQYGYATVEDYAKADLVFVTRQFLWDGPWTPEGEDHWVEAVRDAAGSKNEAFVGFTNWHYITDPSYPMKERMQAALKYQYTTVDADAVLRRLDGTIASYDQGGGSTCGFTEAAHEPLHPNFTDDTTIEFIVDLIVNDWNHCTNREPRVGLMFDVAELFSDEPVSGWPDYDGDGVQDEGEDWTTCAWFGWIVDADQDGTVFDADEDEITAWVAGRKYFFTRLRAQLTASDSEGDVGDYFIIGTNTISGVGDSELLALLDFDLVEGYQTPAVIGNEFFDYDGSSTKITFPYHWAMDPLHERTIWEYLYWYNDYIDNGGWPIPDPVVVDFDTTASKMRQDIGPYILLEGQAGTDPGGPDDPEYNEVFSLLRDNVLTSYIDHTDRFGVNWYRIPYLPDDRSKIFLHGLGDPIEDTQVGTSGSNVYWHREFENGAVEIVIEPVSTWSDAAGDLFEYRVRIGETVARESPAWTTPGTEILITSLTFVDGTPFDDSQDLDMSTDAVGQYQYRTRTCEEESAEPCAGAPTWSSWSSWTTRSGDLVDADPSLTETEELYCGVEMQVRAVGGDVATDAGCVSFASPKL